MKKIRLLLCLIPAVFLFISATAFKQDLQQSGTGTETAAGENWELTLQRDLAFYFSRKFGPDISVAHEFLRRTPTYSGIYPKYYLWVIIRKSGITIDAGAVKVAAIEGKEFRVTDYLPREMIMEEPGSMKPDFPGSLHEEIRNRARAAQ